MIGSAIRQSSGHRGRPASHDCAGGRRTGGSGERSTRRATGPRLGPRPLTGSAQISTRTLGANSSSVGCLSKGTTLVRSCPRNCNGAVDVIHCNSCG